MNDIPPKHTPDDVPPASGNMVTFYQAASNANADSFPVLKAFQDYIEAEREQARKRVVTLSIFFAVIICVVIGGFLATGIYLLRDRANVQDKLFEVAFAQRTPVEPPAPIYITPPAPQIDVVGETVKEISKVTAALQDDIGKRIEGVSEISTQVREKVSAQESEMEKLRQELGQMREQNEQLKGDVEALRAPPPPAAEAVAAPAAPPPAGPATPPAVAVVAAVPEPPLVVIPPLPVEPVLKDPPVTPENVKPPDAPKGMMLTTIPLKSRSGNTLSWRVIIPE